MSSIDPTLEAENAWIAECDEQAAGTLFAVTNSWINGSNIPGKPIINMFWMGGSGPYLDRAELEEKSEYAEHFHLGSASVPV
jgi:hypothetical protein